MNTFRLCGRALMTAAALAAAGFIFGCGGDGGGSVNPPATYTVTVSSAGYGASGGGAYQPNAAVTVTAGTAPVGQVRRGLTASRSPAAPRPSRRRSPSAAAPGGSRLYAVQVAGIPNFSRLYGMHPAGNPNFS